MDVDPVFQEFVDALNALAGAHAFAMQGIEKAREYWTGLVAQAKPPTTADSTVYITQGPQDAPSTVAYSKWRLGDLPELLGGGGSVMTQVSQQWAITLFTEWEAHYRARISKAMGLDKPLQLAAFGDLRHFRNDIVHHRGVATAENSGKAEVFKSWFRQGEPMYFDTYKVAEFMTAVEVFETF
ncbi:MAG TPA: hypothetical protein VH061_09340 [Solirubrobacteraceae bacterium]|jgi:hypothetical protein|nr:hypothetical protein [Solirubrobacteraceae bacterium]